MADTKSKPKTQQKKSDNTSNKKSTSTAKNGQQTKSTTGKNQKADNIAVINGRNQMGAIILFAFALFFAAIVYIPAAVGTVWFGLRGVVFGLFGWSGFIVPFLLIYIAVMLTLNKMNESIGIKIFEGSILLVIICSFFFVSSHGAVADFGADIKNEFMKYFSSSRFGNGLFASLIGEILYLIGKSKGPAYAILFVALFVDFMFFTEFTLVKFLRMFWKPVKKVTKYQKHQYEKFREESEQRKEIKKEKNENKLKEKDGKYFYIYGEDDIGEKESKDEKLNYKITDYNENDALPVTEKDEILDIFNITPNVNNENKNKELTPQEIFEVPVSKKSDINISVSDEDIPQQTINENICSEIADDEKQKKLTKTDIEKGHNEIVSEMNNSEVSADDDFKLPSINLLNPPVKNTRSASQADLQATAQKLISSLHSFNVEATVTEIVPGPSVTRYEVAPAPGVKISKFTGLADDLALHLAAPAGVRIEAPIPNKSAIGIEVPNRGRTTVTMREIVESEIFANAKSKLNVAVGKDIAGNVVCCDIAKMPHLLIAGTTGSGKSVCLNAMIASVLFNAKPSEVKLLLIDPKQVEFSVYDGIPHLLVPVVSEARKAAGALGWAVTEMLNRYKTLNENGVRDIGSYNKLCDTREDLNKMCQIMIVIDELSDLMSVAPSEVEDSITRLAQMARAAGMHLVVATQRPSVDVITGLIKANIPSRMALSVSSQIDSRTILDTAGAEKLLGLGDMLYAPQGTSKPLRVQGCYLSDNEIKKVVEFVKTQEVTVYDDSVQEEINKNALNTAPKKGSKDISGGSGVSDADNEIIMKAAELVIDNPEKASISAFQRNLSLGFSKAGRIMDELENRGVVGPSAGSKPRKVLMTKAMWYEMNAMQSDSHSEEGEEQSDE